MPTVKIKDLTKEEFFAICGIKVKDEESEAKKARRHQMGMNRQYANYRRERFARRMPSYRKSGTIFGKG